MFANSGSISITGMYWGNRTNLDNAIQPLKDLGATVSVGQSRAWIPTLQSLANGKALVQPENYNQHETFFAKSLVTYADELLNSKQLTSFFTYLSTTGRSAPTSWWTLADLYGGYNSTITSQSATSTSYVHRNSLFTFQLYAHTATQRPPFPAAGIQFMNGMVESITGTWEGKKLLSYANYNDPSLGREEALGVYYGAGEVLERLKRVKRVVDPEERFWNPQSVPVA